ncbi:glycoside hydrolase family 2 protein [Plenodomus tracheiphilus IPT5]|uniref:Glycoside hydrolase family 2 protein n=1 Tax=Plenodomus tracheiphilus IPT5 TaxID=1408161 RepID=A0A6A7BBG4_9PLEO|nr:glycoside hydrolase family 2 protein [Plenodomus tracheiphilus IPT5]
MVQLALFALAVSSLTSASTITLNGWKVGSSAEPGTGSVLGLSSPDFDTSRMYTLNASKGTLMSTLLQNPVYNQTQLFYSTNLKDVDTRQFRVPWFYRTEFTLDESSTASHHYSLKTNGITSRADIWLNGKQIANQSTQAGAYTGLEYDISDHVRLGGEKEVLVVKVYPTDYNRDFALGFVDWNPYPPDNGTGIWRDIEVKRTGLATFASLLVDTTRGFDGKIGIELDAFPTLANVGWSCQIECAIYDPRGNQVAFKKEDFTLDPDEAAQAFWTLEIKDPQTWWPRQWGEQPLYSAQCNATTDEGLSDQTPTTRFGIRNVTSHLDAEHKDTTFLVNGKRFQVLGAGYTSDIFLTFDKEKLRAQLRYVLDMGLNTIRLEGKQEHPYLYDLADEMGIMILAGWECCDKWEGWSYNEDGSGEKWTDADYAIAKRSMEHEAEMMRAHPSILGFLVGSDYWPDDRATSNYTHVLDEASWDTPILASASQRGAPKALGNGGMKMDGPYDWVPPNYWYDNQTRLGSAAGFGSELGAGVGTPELGSLKKFLSQSDMDDLWKPESKDKGLYHMSTNVSSFYTRSIYNDALYARYGTPTSLEDYLLKAQMADYEATRAQFEAYTSRWSTSFIRPATGLIYWMLNNAWPSLHWNLFDYYLHPGGSYYGTKAALGKLETAIYDYEDHSVYLVNRRSFPLSWQPPDRVIEIDVIGLDGKSITKTSANATTEPNSSHKVTSIASLSEIKEVVLLRLRLLSSSNTLSRNVYWLAPKLDVLDWDNSTWYHTPVTSYSDFTSLNKMAKADLDVRTQFKGISVLNKGSVPAVFVRFNLVDENGDDRVPVAWSQNYVTLWPGESMDILLNHGKPWPPNSGWSIEVSGKNVDAKVVELK